MKKCETGQYSLPLEERIRRNALAARALETLLAHSGITASKLWDYLHSIDSCRLITLHRWADKSNLSRREAKDLCPRLLSVAADLDRLLTHNYRWYVAVQNGKFLWLKIVPRLLRLSAGFIQALLYATDDRSANPDEELMRKQLTEYVLAATGKPHDKEVADLLGALLERTISPEDQRKFRNRRNKNGNN